MATEMESLIEMLKSGKGDDKPVVDWHAVRAEWCQAIVELFGQIRSWLEPAVQQGLVRISKRPLHRTEDQLGEYDTSILNVERVSGSWLLSLIPQYRLTPHGQGRVDVNAAAGQWQLIRKDTGKWAILHQRVPMQEEPLTEESFARMLKDAIV